jgi:esterase/lipase superfamily enzyme
MRKKWVIIAAVVFLGVVCSVIILDGQSRYLSEEVIAEIEKHGVLFMDTDCGGATPSLGVTLGHPNVFEKMVDWCYSFFDNWKNTQSVHYYMKSGSNYISVITIYEKNKQIYEVEIDPTKGALQDALDIQSKLSKAFPNLLCELTGDEKPVYPTKK